MYYNPSCSKCLYALDFLKQKGITPKLIEYLSDMPSANDLAFFLRQMHLSPLDIIRVKEPLFTEQFEGKQFSDEEWINIIIKNPVLLQRPILVKQDKVVIGRSDESLDEIV